MERTIWLQARWTTTDVVTVYDIHSAREGFQLARRLCSELVESPSMVEFGRLDEASPVLAIGLGRDRSVVTFQDSLDPPYFISLDSDQGPGTIVFIYAQEPTEYALQNSVPIESALIGLQEFIESGRRPVSLSWERL